MSSIASLLAAMQGNSSGITGASQPSAPPPDSVPSGDQFSNSYDQAILGGPPQTTPNGPAISQPAISQPQVQQQSAPQIQNPQTQQPGQDQTQLGPQMHGIKNWLSNFLYQAGEGAKERLGMQTDAQKQQAALKMQNDTLNAQADRVEKQARARYYYAQAQEQQGQPLTADEAAFYGLPIGTPLNSKDRTSLAKQILANQGKVVVQNLKNDAPNKNPDAIKQALAEAKAASDAGDTDTFTKKINLVHQLMQAKTSPPNNEISLIIKANQGDPDAQKALDVLQQRRIQIGTTRANAFGKSRLYMLQKVYDPETGDTDFMTGYDILANNAAGKKVIPTGGLPQDKIIAVQQLQSEAKPAIQQVRQNLAAFDNAADRAIFARVMKSAGTPGRGDEASWIGNVMNQAAKEGLSPEGQRLAIAEGRMAETLGRMRSVLGLQATDSAMALTMRLMPGASTPNSNYAKQQVDTLDNMITQAVNIPALGGKNRAAVPTAPPSNRPPLSSFERH